MGTINPPTEHVVLCFRSLLTSLYGNAADALGFSRWGIKEVREDPRLRPWIRLLFPESKFIFLIGNPFDSIVSMKRRNFGFADDWGCSLPPHPHIYYAHRWVRCVQEVAAADDAFILTYQDLISPNFSSENLCRYLEIDRLDPSFISAQHVDWKAPSPEQSLSATEIEEIQAIVEPTLTQWQEKQGGL